MIYYSNIANHARHPRQLIIEIMMDKKNSCSRNNKIFIQINITYEDPTIVSSLINEFFATVGSKITYDINIDDN